jgi:predicted HAD superfamily Cof-like phosphohydrolase
MKTEDLTGKMLVEFISTFKGSLDPMLWANLVREEMKELKEALHDESKEEVLKEATDLMYVTIGFNFVSVGAEQLSLFGDERHAEMMELLKESGETYTKAVDYLPDGTNFFEAFRRVHLSNMSKLDDDGKPLFREDGKVLKGPNYVKPKLGDLVDV